MERVHVWIFRDDARFLRETYGRNIGVAKAIRTLVHSFRKRVDERIAEREPRIDINIDELLEEANLE
jgi:hypothetical protein